MTVLHVGSVCGHGGVETFLATLAREQRRAGIPAEVFFFRDLGGGSHYDGICSVHFGGRSELARIISSTRCDVLHTVTYVAEDVAAAVQTARFRGAVVVTSHQCGEFESSLAPDCLTAVSAAVAKSIQEHYPMPVRVVHNGVDVERFTPRLVPYDGKPIIAWVGRANDPMKDFPAVLALANSPASARFLGIVVDGSPVDEESTIWLPPNFAVQRRLKWEDMPEFYRQVRSSHGFLLSTSSMEPFGLSVLEAMACGCPVIAPSSGGIPEFVVHKRTGYLYDRCDGVPGIEHAIDWLYEGEHYEQVSQAAAEHVAQHFSAAAMCRRYTDVYEEALAARPAR